MRFERLTDCHDPRYETARTLYRRSFPRHEQREAASQAAILAHPAYRFDLIYDGDEFVGLLLCWETDDFIYVEHFCIERTNAAVAMAPARSSCWARRARRSFWRSTRPSTRFPSGAGAFMSARTFGPIPIRTFITPIMRTARGTSW